MMSWNFPNIYKLWGLPKTKNYYASRFSDAASVAAYTAEHYPRLREETARWTDTWYDSTLPEWFMDRTVLTANTLQTANCWLLEDGQFWAWEGVVYSSSSSRSNWNACSADFAVSRKRRWCSLTVRSASTGSICEKNGFEQRIS